MAENIKPKLSLGLQDTWKTVSAKIGKGAANAPSNGTVLPAGYPVFVSAVSGQDYDALDKTGIAAATGKLGILLEPWTVAATQDPVKIAYAGEFDADGIYEACTGLFGKTDVPLLLLANAAGHIVINNRDAVEIYQ